MRSCYVSVCFFIISLIIIVYVFVFQNIIIDKRNFYVFATFRDSQLVFVPLKKTIIFYSSIQSFLIPTANLLIIVLTVSRQWWYQLFPHEAEYFHLLKHFLQLLFFSYSYIAVTPGFDPKDQNLLLSTSIPI